MTEDIIIPGVCAEAVKALKDAERGRLILAVMVYQAEGRALSLCGGERYLWPEFKAELDRRRERQEEIRRARAEGGKKGGRPKKADEGAKKPQGFEKKAKKPQGFAPPSSLLENPLISPDSNNIYINNITTKGYMGCDRGGPGGEREGGTPDLLNIWEEHKRCDCLTAGKTRCKRRASYEFKGVRYCAQHAKNVIAPAPGKRHPFVPPSLEEVTAYCLERRNGIDPEAFLAHYEANGWVQGKTCKPIVDWKACVRTWERSRAAWNDQPFERQQEAQKPAAPRFVGTEIIDGEEVAVFENPGG